MSIASRFIILIISCLSSCLRVGGWAMFWGVLVVINYAIYQLRNFQMCRILKQNITTYILNYILREPHTKKEIWNLKTRLYTDNEMLTAIEKFKSGKFTYRQCVEKTDIAVLKPLQIPPSSEDYNIAFNYEHNSIVQSYGILCQESPAWGGKYSC